MPSTILSPLNRLRHLNYSFRRSGKIYQWTRSLCSFHSWLKEKTVFKVDHFFSQKEAIVAYTHLIPKGAMPFGWRYYSAPVRAERSGLSDLACICTNRESVSQGRISLSSFLIHRLSSLSLWGRKLCLVQWQILGPSFTHLACSAPIEAT